MPTAPVDLHIHSGHSSDGEFAPEELVAMAERDGVSVLAIADHNLTTAVQPAIDAARGGGVEVIPAVELDCQHNGLPIHVLGYFINHLDGRYAELWEDVERQEVAASERRMRGVRDLGIVLDEKAVLAHSRGGIVTGEIMAELALADPANRDNPLLDPYRPGGGRDDNPFVNFHWDFCAKGKPAYVEIRFMSLAEAVALVTGTGGVPVLAHPKMVIGHCPEVLPELAGLGIKGLEAYSGYHSEKECADWRRAGEELGLVITCGSDFHGKTKPVIRLGGHGAPDAERLMDRLRRAAR